MKSPLISILIPFKNTDKYIADCLQSIINQTYQNWELIIVDDGSTDKTYSIVETFSEIDSRIVLLKNNGSGIIGALRFAFEHSKGTLITRMDSDDLMTANRLEVMSNSLSSHGKGHVALGLVKYFSNEGISEGYKKYEIWLNQLTKSGSNYSEIYKECVIPSPCWMVHKEDLIACNAFNEDIYPEDYDLAFRFYEYNLKCIPCGTILHHWRDYNVRTSRIHEHYAENHFISLKLRYFLKLHYSKQKTLVIWGAGNKGKTLAKGLIDQKIPFTWICDNPKKIGRDIYGQILKPFNHLSEIEKPQSIITVANEEAQKEIRLYLEKQNMQSMTDYFFFC